jgi:hypothetical protein
VKPRTLTAEQVLRLTLVRQGLDRRLAKADPAAAVQRFGPLHATDRATPYLSLLARIQAFRFEDLDRAWLAERELDRRSAMRGTFHLVPRARVRMIVCVVAAGDPADVRNLRQAGVAPDVAKRLRRAVERVIDASGPSDVAGIKRALPESTRTEALAKTKGGGSTLALVLAWMAEAGFLAAAARKDPRTGAIQGGWAHAPLVYERFETAFGKLERCRQPEADAALARWYFEAHGPAAFEDWAWWNGLSAVRSRAAFELVRGDLEEVAVADWPPLYLPRGALEQADPGRTQGGPQDGREVGPLEGPQEGPVVRLVPYEEGAIKAYRATRQRYFDPAVTERSHTLYGEVLPTILVDGRVAGMWSAGAGGWSGALVAASGRSHRGLTTELFGRADRAVSRALDGEVERVRQAFAEASDATARVDAPAGGG